MNAMKPPVDDPARTKPSNRGRRAVWLAVGVAVLWLMFGSLAGPLAGKLNEVQTNDNASFLPASAESTLVADEQATFSEDKSFPILIVVTRPDGGALSPSDLDEVTTFAAELPGIEVEPGKTLADFVPPGQIVPIPSQDGKAVLINVPLIGEKASENLANGELAVASITESLREVAAQVPDLDINVTGPGGILADLIKVFGAIDSTLLGVTAVVVAIILILVYRSPFLWLIPLLAAGMALSAASAVVYVLAKNDIVVLNGQSQGILTVLVFGAGTDYALLLVARYREELHRYEAHTDAMRAALRGVVEPIAASAATVVIGLMCLLLSELNSNRSTGPVGAAGIVAALVVMLTFLPALLIIPSVVLPILAFIVPTIIGLVLSFFTDLLFRFSSRLAFVFFPRFALGFFTHLLFFGFPGLAFSALRSLALGGFSQAEFLLHTQLQRHGIMSRTLLSFPSQTASLFPDFTFSVQPRRALLFKPSLKAFAFCRLFAQPLLHFGPCAGFSLPHHLLGLFPREALGLLAGFLCCFAPIPRLAFP